PELQVGDKVKPRQFIGEIGNSGTSHGVKGIPCGAHLHFEIWIDQQFFGHNLEVDEIREILGEVLQ
ncbi:MAG: M23 family peptidase, partial [Candidatus Syntrophonatronum acetioxidans]